MCEHANDFSMLDGEALNADLPQRIRYSSLNDRILDIAIPTTMPGEMEIVCLAKVLQTPIHVVGEDNMFISRYGDDAIGNSPLTVRYRRVGEDVGHYDCLLRNNMNRSFEQVNASETRDIIHGISPLPKRLPKKTKRAIKTESAAILTSSPYQKSLQERTKKRQSKAKKPVHDIRRKKKNARKSYKNDDGSSEEEDWPCLICAEPYSRTRPGDTWVERQVCRNWAHEESTSGQAQFICPNCDSDDSC